MWPIIIIAIIVVILIISALVSSNDNKWSDNKSQNYQSWRESSPDGTFTIYEKKGPVTLIKSYEGGDRYIDGHKCNSADDMERWYVKRGFAEGIERRLHEVEDILGKLNVEGGEELYDEWQRRYNDYRKLCIEHGFWNYVIDDRNTFIPTTSQIAKEEEKKKEILDLLEAWKTRMSENQIIVEYLKKSPRKHALKKVMIKDISNGDSEKRKTINAIYRRLIRAKVFAEKENHDGEIETRIVIHRKKKEISKKPMPASVYHSDLYSNIRKKDIYKVDYTVSEPQDLDRQNNTCYFVSKSSGEIYSTSLEKCSCPVYQKGCACKHMLALAMRLGYYQRWNAQ